MFPVRSLKIQETAVNGLKILFFTGADEVLQASISRKLSVSREEKIISFAG